VPRPPRLITANGVTRTLTEWAHELGLKIPTLFQRLARGWSPEEAIGLPRTDPHAPHDWSTIKDITGQRFGSRVVVARSGKDSPAKWHVRCDCGSEDVVSGVSLRNGSSMSCGCVRNMDTAIRSRTHGASSGGKRTPEFRIWCGMKSRCHRPRAKEMQVYSARGITVCKRWLGHDGFANFLSDMGTRPSPKHSIDRFPNNDGNYEPGNCRWATALQQARNSRHGHWVEVNGIKKRLMEWSIDGGLNAMTILGRLTRGWDPRDAVFAPPIRRGGRYHGHRRATHDA